MEEFVGKVWDRFITRMAYTGYPEAAVRLDEVSMPVGVLFRALGGDGGLRVEAAQATGHKARRGWLQRVAGTGDQVELAWRDEQSLRLPAVIDLFPSRDLNRKLYLWLAALASAPMDFGLPWFERNQRMTQRTLEQYPGLRANYQALVQAHLAQRKDPGGLSADEAGQERAIRNALLDPGSVQALPAASRPPQPVNLWLHPEPPQPAATVKRRRDPDKDETQERGGTTHAPKDKRRRRAEQVNMPNTKRSLIALRMEYIFGMAEFVKVDRGSEDEDDMERAARAADDLDVLSVTGEETTMASRIRFDLDLPSEANDDTRLGEGFLFPEWDYKKAILKPDHCRLQPMLATDAEPCELPQRLRKSARRLKNQFQILAPTRVWHCGQPDGNEVDLDAYERFVTQRASGGGAADDANLYRDLKGGGRDLACLLLADLSLSTDTWINNDARVIDVIRDSLFLFSEALSATGDAFALYGFSSRRRDHVRFHVLKNFSDSYGAVVRGRLATIKPGYYTRMGAGIRQAAQILEKQRSSRRLLLILTDGKPNDLDQYEGRYGIEDTRMAIIEARRKGLQPFCVTIDEEADDYLPHLFGSKGFIVIRRPEELPRQLPQLYAQLTA